MDREIHDFPHKLNLHSTGGFSSYRIPPGGLCSYIRSPQWAKQWSRPGHAGRGKAPWRITAVFVSGFGKLENHGTKHFYGGFLSHRGTPKSSILVVCSLINQPFYGYPHDYGKPPYGVNMLKTSCSPIDWLPFIGLSHVFWIQIFGLSIERRGWPLGQNHHLGRYIWRMFIPWTWKYPHGCLYGIKRKYKQHVLAYCQYHITNGQSICSFWMPSIWIHTRCVNSTIQMYSFFWSFYIIPNRGTRPGKLTQLAYENGHKNSGCSHEKWWFSILMLVYQAGSISLGGLPYREPGNTKGTCFYTKLSTQLDQRLKGLLCKMINEFFHPIVNSCILPNLTIKLCLSNYRVYYPIW